MSRLLYKKLNNRISSFNRSAFSLVCTEFPRSSLLSQKSLLPSCCSNSAFFESLFKSRYLSSSSPILSTKNDNLDPVTPRAPVAISESPKGCKMSCNSQNQNPVMDDKYPRIVITLKTEEEIALEKKRISLKETEKKVHVEVVNVDLNIKIKEPVIEKILPPETKQQVKETEILAELKKDSGDKSVVAEKGKVNLPIMKKVVVKAEVDKEAKVTKISFEKPKDVRVPQDVSRKKKLMIDYTGSYTERNFITPIRAIEEYLLKQSDLETLPKVLRRSPYENEPPITVHSRKDVEAKAIEVWGSKEALEKEILRREIDRRRYEQDVFTVKRRLRNYRREMGARKAGSIVEPQGLQSRSGHVVLTAVAINGCNFVFKLCAWVYTGSHSMFSECIHSLADTINQVILAYGIHKSVQRADPYHPYGYTNMRYVSSLISGVGILCIGSGLSYYHGIMGILAPEPLQDFFWAYFVIGGAAVSEGATLMVAINAVRKGAREANLTFKEYVMRSTDPSVNVVLLEDTAAVAGLVAAGGCMALAQYTGSALPDAVGSLLVGTVLGGVASFIILSNIGALVGRSIPQEQLEEMNMFLERDFMIRAIHDVKGIDMGSNLIRYKAEIDFDGRALTRCYLDKQDLTVLLQDAKKLETTDDLEAFLLKHGENIVDMLGGEIDRIELKLRKKFPQIRHCDLEIL